MNINFLTSVVLSAAIHILVFFFLSIHSASSFYPEAYNKKILTIDFLTIQPHSSEHLLSDSSSSKNSSISNSNFNKKDVIKNDSQTTKEEKSESDNYQLLGNSGESEILAPIPTIKYYRLSELDQKPEMVSKIENNPPELRKFSLGGEMTIRVWINQDGVVVNAEIVKSELPDEFNTSALNAFKNAKFLPGQKNNQSVNSVAKIVVQYGKTSN